MMKITAFLLFFSFLVVLAADPAAVGSVARPEMALPGAAAVSPMVPAAKKAPNQRHARSKRKISTERLAILARFRPIAKKNRRLEQAPLEDRRTIDEIYDHDMNQRLWNQYRGTVVPYQKEAENPYRHATPWEKERYEHSRKELAHWALKQIGQDQLKDFVRRRRQDSSALDLVATSTGMPKEDDASGRKVETHAAHIRPAQAAAAAPQSEDEEPSTPTRLKAHLNVLKVRGQLTFTNPVITTSVEAKAGSRDDNLSLEMNREFHEIEMNSKVRYGVDQAVLLVNVNKRITDEVSVDLNSERWTGSRRGASGEKKREEAKVTYSLSF